MAGKIPTPIRELPAENRARLDAVLRVGLERRAERLAREAAERATAGGEER